MVRLYSFGRFPHRSFENTTGDPATAMACAKPGSSGAGAPKCLPCEGGEASGLKVYSALELEKASKNKSVPTKVSSDVMVLYYLATLL